MKRIFLADYLKIKPESTNFAYLISASYKYGLTKGNEKSDYISLTPLGESIVKTTETERIPFLQEACQKIPVFQRFYQRYLNAKLPSDEYARKLLKDEFEVPEEHADECYHLIVTNGRFSGIIRDLAGAPRVVFETTPTPTEEAREEEKEGEEPEGETEEEKVEPPNEEAKKPRVFISHSKNKKIVDQIKQILDSLNMSLQKRLKQQLYQFLRKSLD